MCSRSSRNCCRSFAGSADIRIADVRETMTRGRSSRKHVCSTISVNGCGHSSIPIRLLRLPGGVSLFLQPWLNVSFAHIACGFQL